MLKSTYRVYQYIIIISNAKLYVRLTLGNTQMWVFIWKAIGPKNALP